jgi:Protein of unknown function (DUF2752)
MRLHLEHSGTGWERVVTFLGLPAVGLGAVWLWFGLPTPICVFRSITGLPCLTCGGTRCLRSVVHGDFVGAWMWNPLVFAALVVTAGILAYATAVTLFRLPRLRIAGFGARETAWLRGTIVMLAVGNWAYLIIRASRSA